MQRGIYNLHVIFDPYSPYVPQGPYGSFVPYTPLHMGHPYMQTQNPYFMTTTSTSTLMTNVSPYFIPSQS